MIIAYTVFKMVNVGNRIVFEKTKQLQAPLAKIALYHTALSLS